MAKYIIGDKVFNTHKAKRIIQYTKYEIFRSIATITLYRTAEGKWIEVKKFDHIYDVEVNIRNSEYVGELLKELNAIKAYEKYFGKLKEV